MMGNPAPVPGNPAFIGPLAPAAAAPAAANNGAQLLGVFRDIRRFLALGGITAILMKLVSAINQLTKAIVDGARDRSRFVQLTGLSQGQDLRFRRLGQISGVSEEEMRSNLVNLRKQSERVRMGTDDEAAAAYSRLGIDARLSPDEQAKQFAKVTQNMNAATQAFFADTLGLSDGFVRALRNIDRLNDGVSEMATTVEEDRATMRIGEIISGTIFDIKNGFIKLFGTLASGRLPDSEAMLLQALQNQPGVRSSAAPVNTTNNVKVEINGVENANDVKRATKDALKDVLGDDYYGRQPALNNR